MENALYKSVNIPTEYYRMAFLLMLMFGLAHFCVKRKVAISAAWGVLSGYLFLIFSTTVLAREIKPEYDYDFELFWSYTAIKAGRGDLLFLNIANLLMLMPVGFLIGCIGVERYRWATLIGVGISGVIEFTQLLLKRGMFEFDDIFHNALGCVVGYLVYRVFKWVREKMRWVINGK